MTLLSNRYPPLLSIPFLWVLKTIPARGIAIKNNNFRQKSCRKLLFVRIATMAYSWFTQQRFLSPNPLSIFET